MVLIHGADRTLEVVPAHLYAMGDARRAQEQKTLEQFVIVNASVNVPVTEESFKNTSLLDVLKDGHVDPWLVLVRIHTYLSSCNPPPSRAK
ncbi:MAG TPA: hypothetical protein VMF08_18255 [Candidatus Sulfotelmatobacter sp.]|nr:hypothetical protein [Candidatus Sulfotelmatobacter sp.]